MLFINYIKKYSTPILFLLVILLLSLWIAQCQKTAEVEIELNNVVNTANQNLESLVGDQSTQLKLTRDQLKKVDSRIAALVDSVEKFKNIQGKTKEVVVTKIEYVPQNLKLPNTLVIDSVNARYGLSFTNKDSVRSIEGISWFQVIDTLDNKLLIKPDSTDISDFKFNFDLVISKYEDESTKFTKYDITPYYINPDGSIGRPISKDLLKLNYRGVELLNQPWVDNPAPITENRKAGWAIHFSPVSVGFVTNGEQTIFGVGPTMGLSYTIPLKK